MSEKLQMSPDVQQIVDMMLDFIDNKVLDNLSLCYNGKPIIKVEKAMEDEE